MIPTAEAISMYKQNVRSQRIRPSPRTMVRPRLLKFAVLAPFLVLSSSTEAWILHSRNPSPLLHQSESRSQIRFPVFGQANDGRGSSEKGPSSSAGKNSINRGSSGATPQQQNGRSTSSTSSTSKSRKTSPQPPPSTAAALTQQPPQNNASTSNSPAAPSNTKRRRRRPARRANQQRSTNSNSDRSQNQQQKQQQSSNSESDSSPILPSPDPAVSSNSFSDRNRKRRNRPRKTPTMGSKSATGFQQKPQQRDNHSSIPKIKKRDSSANVGPSHSSLLPPLSESELPLHRRGGGSTSNTSSNREDDASSLTTTGLSSWEQFLGGGTKSSSNSKSTSPASQGNTDGGRNPKDGEGQNSRKTRGGGGGSSSSSSSNERRKAASLSDDRMGRASSTIPDHQRLPSIQDLFPPDVLSSSSPGSTATSDNKRNDDDDGSKSQGSRSSSSSSGNESRSPSSSSSLDGVLPVSDLFYRSSQDDEEEEEDHDDEELPFSAEQSDAISINDNKIRIRRNLAQTGDGASASEGTTTAKNKSTTASSATTKKSNNSAGGRKKMSRRGMDMLVGGVPINADPPQRSVQLFYDGETDDWAAAITLSTRDFGPLLHAGSVGRLTDEQRGLFCEHFCHAANKWDICPKDLRQIVRAHRSSVNSSYSRSKRETVTAKKKSAEAVKERSADKRTEEASQPKRGLTKSTAFRKTHSEPTDHGDEDFFESRGEFSFEIGVSLEELQSAKGGEDGDIFRSVFAHAFMSILEKGVGAASKAAEDFVVEIPNLVLKESDDGYTHVTVEFKVEAGFATSYSDMERRVKRLGAVFTQAIDDGEIALAIAAAAKNEKRWPKAVRDRVVEECLFQDDEGADEFAENEPLYSDDVITEGPLILDEELNLGAGNDCFFYDISSPQKSPYGGEIGPQLLEAVVRKAKERQPRVIAIGDVHGCIDELQDLLRQCDYRPGDLVVFLGDLVCKGADSISVVQMAREIGAIGVRGNHDFEVVRWHQAIKSGVDPPVVRSEHYHIASCLSKADMKWMHSLPWYIMSRELESLFVHAGFVSGIRLKKQNPRLMMNMRSILPDGTVTSKFFNNWPWARLWDGPRTVLFGHDADRGLQQYEHAIGLDTGCVYGGRLTACILPEKRLVSVSARREYFKHRRKHYD